MMNMEARFGDESGIKIGRRKSSRGVHQERRKAADGWHRTFPLWMPWRRRQETKREGSPPVNHLFPLLSSPLSGFRHSSCAEFRVLWQRNFLGWGSFVCRTAYRKQRMEDKKPTASSLSSRTADDLFGQKDAAASSASSSSSSYFSSVFPPVSSVPSPAAFVPVDCD